jgi:hypothetical protein
MSPPIVHVGEQAAWEAGLGKKDPDTSRVMISARAALALTSPAVASVTARKLTCAHLVVFTVLSPQKLFRPGNAVLADWVATVIEQRRQRYKLHPVSHTNQEPASAGSFRQAPVAAGNRAAAKVKNKFKFYCGGISASLLARLRCSARILDHLQQAASPAR